MNLEIALAMFRKQIWIPYNRQIQFFIPFPRFFQQMSPNYDSTIPLVSGIICQLSFGMVREDFITDYLLYSTFIYLKNNEKSYLIIRH